MHKPFVCLAILLALAASRDAAAVETVRVDASSGAPRLVVDGKPVRARMFFGMPGTKPVKASAAGGPIAFEFVAVQDAPRTGTMHFRFGQAPGSVELDDIRVEDLTTGQDALPRCDFEMGTAAFTSAWRIWPPDEKNTVGQVEVRPGGGREGSAGLCITL